MGYTKAKGKKAEENGKAKESKIVKAILKCIEEIKDAADVCTELVLTKCSFEDGEEFHEIYDRETCEYIRVKYVYPIEYLLAPKTPKMQRLVKALNDGEDVSYEDAKMIISTFFKMKKRGLATSPKTDDEEIVLDWSYDLEDDEDKENLEKELSELSFFDKAFFLRNVSVGERYFVKTKDNILVNPRRVDEFFYAMCNLLTRALDSLV